MRWVEDNFSGTRGKKWESRIRNVGVTVVFSRRKRKAGVEEVVEDPVHEGGHRELPPGALVVLDLEAVEAMDVAVLDAGLVEAAARHGGPQPSSGSP